jgi:hypothetical protein
MAKGARKVLRTVGSALKGIGLRWDFGGVEDGLGKVRVTLTDEDGNPVVGWSWGIKTAAGPLSPREVKHVLHAHSDGFETMTVMFNPATVALAQVVANITSGVFDVHQHLSKNVDVDGDND